MKRQIRTYIPCVLLTLSSFLMLSGLSSCQLERKRSADEKKDATLVDPKYSLSSDRSEFEKLRENVSEDKKKANDEKALIAQWMAGYRLAPQEVKERFDNLVRKKREAFNKDMTKIREDNSKTERKKRDLFLKDLEEERTQFSKRKRDRDERNDFFNELDQKRKDFFSEEKEKRSEFESDYLDQRKNFEDYIREKTMDFNNELKVYSENWKAQQKPRD